MTTLIDPVSQHVPFVSSDYEWRFRALEAVDLSKIRLKLTKARELGGQGYTHAQAEDAEKWYRRFLMICIKYPKFSPVPSRAVDDFWHLHILDTMKYAEDCRACAGRFLHHCPSYGGDERELDALYAETDMLYQQEFGETYQISANSCSKSGCNVCCQKNCYNQCTKKP